MTVPLVSAAEVALGRQRAPQYETGDNLVPYLRSANIVDGFLDISDVKSMNFTPREQAIFGLRVGDVLVTEGSGSRAAVGASSVWRGEISGTVCFQNTVLRLRPRLGITDGRYIGWWARHAHAAGRFAAVASGANILHLGAEQLRREPLALPELSQQGRIADFLDDQVSRIDQVIALRAKQIELSRARYRAWLADEVETLGELHGFTALRRHIVRIEQGWSPVCDSRRAAEGESGVIKLGAVRRGDYDPSENKAFAMGLDFRTFQGPKHGITESENEKGI